MEFMQSLSTLVPEGNWFWFYSAIALFISVFSIFLFACRYKIFLEKLNEKISMSHSFLITSISFFLNYISFLRIESLIGRPIASKFIAQIPVKKAFFVSLFEQFLELGCQVLILVAIPFLVSENILFENSLKITSALSILFALVLIAVIFNKKIIVLLMKLKSFAPRKIKEIGKRAGLSEEEIKKSFGEIALYFADWKFLLVLMIPTLLNILISPLIVLYSAKALLINLSYTSAFIIYWVSMIVGRISGLPGGFVSRDLTMGGLLLGFGVGAVVSLKIVVLYRIISMLPALLIGGPGFFYLGKKINFKKLIKG